MDKINQEELITAFAQIPMEQLYRMILSKPQKNADNQYLKLVIFKKVNGKNQDQSTKAEEDSYYQVEQYTAKQVFHQNISKEDIVTFCIQQMEQAFLQFNAWDEETEYQLSISKKGKIFSKKTRQNNQNKPQKQTEHNREKHYLLPEGQLVPPLQDMGIFTAQGKVVAQMHDKYKQINRFLELIDDAIKNYKYDESRPLKIVDFGCGKSYLTFVLYYYFSEIKHMKVRMIGLDLKEDVIKKCNATAQKYGYDQLSFQVGDIGCYQDSVPADMVITLHACDTATDYALYHAVKWGAKMIFSVPCCQHELNQQYQASSMQIIGRYGIVKERTMALFTDAIRANLLECCGYKTQLLEFVDLENTPKNLLIRAVNRNTNPTKMQAASKQPAKGGYLEEVEELMQEFHLEPTLYKLLKADGLMLL